jgi:lysozyme
VASDRIKRAIALAAAIAVPAEGLRQLAYYDPPGILTVCYGHTGADVVKGKRYSLEQCKAFLDADMLHAVKTVERCQPGLPENVLAAFSDAVYNMGPKIACDTRPSPDGSTAARMLQRGDITAACNQLPRWNKARVSGMLVELPGLTKRRAKEQALCLGDK